MVIFLGGYSGKAKDSGNEYNRYTLAEVKQDGNGKLQGYVKDFFAREKLKTDGFEFGDVVEAKFEASEFLGGKPDLIGLVKVEESPFKAVL